MSRIFLLRHAHSTANAKGILAGRLENIALSKDGYMQRDKLDSRLSETSFSQIISSPMQRCRETILNIESNPEIVEEFQEVHYGDWTGKKLSLLSLKKEWRMVQKTPSRMVFPGGEALVDVQKRAMKSVMKSIERNKGGVVLIVSHGDVIKAIIAEALELDLDKFQKIVIDPAAISVLDFSNKKFRLLHLNDSSTQFDYLSKKSRSLKSVVGGGSGRA